MYVNCKTYFSLHYGTFATDELVTNASGLGIDSLALTNINTTCDAWEFVKCCKKENIKPILGAEIRNEEKLLYILLAKNNKGFASINFFLSTHLLSKEPFPDTTGYPLIDDCYIIYPLGAKPFDRLTENEYIGL